MYLPLNVFSLVQLSLVTLGSSSRISLIALSYSLTVEAFQNNSNKSRNMDHLEDEGSEAKVLIIYTGGTIGIESYSKNSDLLLMLIMLFFRNDAK